MTRPLRLGAALFALVLAAGTLLAVTASPSSAITTDHSWPVLKQGSVCDNVYVAQSMLRANGYTIGVDGVFGTQTNTVVRHFQRDHGLTVDGVIGPATWSRLVVTTRYGSSGPAVSAVQHKLAGPYGVAVDGNFGSRTQAAVRHFKLDHGLTVDGVAGLHFWNQVLHHLAVPTPGFAHRTFTGGTSHSSAWGPGGPKVVDVRVGRHPGYDRFVIEFNGPVPAYVVAPHGVTFTLSPKGTKVTLDGTAGVRIALEPIAWTSYTGTHGFHVEFPYLRQVRLTENYEGTQQWGLGIQGVPLLRVFTLTSPYRLVVDVTIG